MPTEEDNGLPEARTGTDPTSRARKLRHLRRILLALAGIAVITELILPWSFGKLGKRASSRANDELRECDGLDAARSARRWFSWQGWAPGWADTAMEGKRDLVFQITNGLTVCSFSKPPPEGFVDRTAGYLRGLLREVAPDPDGSYGSRYQVEELLHRFGRDRMTVDLESELPAGGDVSERVRAHLYLGDLSGAAAVWREPKAQVHEEYTPQLLTQGVVLCMAGDYPAAMPAFERRLALLEQLPRQWSLPQHVADYAECAIRAGKPELVAELTKQHPGVAGSAYYHAAVALERGNYDAAEAAIPNDLKGADVLYAALLCGIRARSGDLPGTFEASQTQSLHHEVISLSAPNRTRAELYNTIFFPVIDERYLLEAATLLASPGDDPRAAEMRRAAAELYALVAARLGRRWDPRAAEMLDRCRKLAPDWPVPDQLDTLLAFFHGDWKRFDQRAGEDFADLRTLGERLRVAASEGGQGDPKRADELALSGLNPSGTRTFETIETLLRSKLSPAQKLGTLRVQLLEAPLPSLFFRLTNVVVYGRLLGADVTPFEEQLAALRAMLAAQPNLMLFADHIRAPSF